MHYDGAKHKTIIGPTKRKKVRTVDFGDTLTAILKKARKKQLKNQMQYGELYHRNYYKEVHDKNRGYYEYYKFGICFPKSESDFLCFLFIKVELEQGGGKFPIGEDNCLTAYRNGVFFIGCFKIFVCCA